MNDGNIKNKHQEASVPSAASITRTRCEAARKDRVHAEGCSPAEMEDFYLSLHDYKYSLIYYVNNSGTHAQDGLQECQHDFSNEKFQLETIGLVCFHCDGQRKRNAQTMIPFGYIFADKETAEARIC